MAVAGYRHPCITGRCIADDLGTAVPLPEVARRADVDHDLATKLRGIADHTPNGLKAISGLHQHPRPLPAFRIQSGRWRGCTVLTTLGKGLTVVWLMAGALRQDGTRADAYVHFESLHDGDRLVATEADWLSAAVEILLWHDLPEAAVAAIEVCEAAIQSPETTFDYSSELAPMAVYAYVLEPEPGDNGPSIAELAVGFSHSTVATQVGEKFVHGKVLEAISAHFGIAYEDWKEAWLADLPPATVQYVVVLAI